MDTDRTLGQINDVTITAEKSAAWGALALIPFYTLLGVKLFRLKPAQALAGSIPAVFLHYFSEIWHQLGHARAAKNTGYPMDGIHLWGVLGTSTYPPDEPPLPPEVHIKRALGGPKASIKAVAAGGLLALVFRRSGGIPAMITTLFALENLMVFVIGAFIPLRQIETDGTVLLRHRHHLRRPSSTTEE